MVPHVFLEGALIAEGIVAHQWLLVKEAIEAFGQAVAQDGGVVAFTVGGVVLELGMSRLSAYPTLFVGDGVQAYV